jgi:hypothetical protein
VTIFLVLALVLIAAGTREHVSRSRRGAAGHDDEDSG